MRDCGEFTSAFHFDHSEREKWANELGNSSIIHQSSTTNKDQVLLDAGVRLLTLDVMEMELDNVLDYAEQTQLVNSQVVTQLRRFSEEMRRNCRDVRELGIPSTFVHGYLYFSNIYRRHGTEISHEIGDFGESTISHPFIDILGCGIRPVYSENWVNFAATNLPEIAPITKEKLLDGQEPVLFAVFIMGSSQAVRRDESR